MAPSRTRTVKNKHAANKSGIRNSKSARDAKPDLVVKAKKSRGALPLTSRAKGRPSLLEQLKKRKQKVYTEKELGLPKLNMVTPAGVQKPRGKKKGKVFVDDRESMSTILAMVQAEREGKIESKLIRARQMEEIREARRAEAEKKEASRKAKFDETKESLRKKRIRKPVSAEQASETAAEGKQASGKKTKRVSFA